MKTLVILLLILTSIFATAQDNVTIKFIRPSKVQGSAAKIRIIIKNAEYIIKNGSEISVNVPHDYSQSLPIEAKASGGKTNYTLRPKPGEKYVFEVGFEFTGIYLKHLEGVELAVDEVVKKTEGEEGEAKFRVDRDGKAIGFTIEKVDQSEAIRQEWLARGGRIKYESVQFTGTYFGMDIKDYNTRVDGYGGGASYAQNWIKLKIPEYKTGASSWSSFNYGWGFDMLLYRYKLNVNIDPSSNMDMSAVTLSYPISANLGWTLGIGKFIDEGNWKGVAITFKYKPSLMLNIASTTSEITMSAPINTTITEYNSDATADMNLGGFGIDFVFSNFTATMHKLAPKPKTKFSLFVLPPVGNSPLFISFSIGTSWYSR